VWALLCCLRRLARPTVDLSQIATWKMDREANQKAYGRAHYALVTMQRCGRSLKTGPAQCKVNDSETYFIIPDAARLVTWRDYRNGIKSGKAQIGLDKPMLTGGYACDIRMRTQGRHQQSLHLKEHS
jgi:hypothetical protein